MKIDKRRCMNEIHLYYIIRRLHAPFSLETECLLAENFILEAESKLIQEADQVPNGSQDWEACLTIT